MIEPSPDHIAIERACRAFGVGEDVTRPANLVDESSGAIRFEVRVGDVLPTRLRPRAQVLGALICDAARKVTKSNAFPSSTPPDLTTRQLDRTTPVARGARDREIGKLLNLGKDTVHKHIQTAMKHNDVATRTRLGMRAFFSAQSSFDA